MTASTTQTVYIGTYTPPGGRAEGIYTYRMNANGTLTRTHTSPSISPSFVALSPRRDYLYAANRQAQTVYTVNETPEGEVSAFAVNTTDGALVPLNRQPTHGVSPCHLVVDPTSRWLLVANYTSGEFVVYPLSDNGEIGAASHIWRGEGHGANPRRQEGPHAHMVGFDPTGRFALGCDLGIDRTHIFRLDDTGHLTPNDAMPFAPSKPGAGPRHFAFHPGGRFLYVNNELDSTISAFAFDPDAGAATALHSLSTLPADFAGNNTTAEIAMHPTGRFVYVSNRGHDSIAMYAIDEATGRLTSLGNEHSGGREPRGFGVDPTGAFLLAGNQHTDTLVTFRIDAQTGRLTPTGQMTSVPSPVCVLFA